MSPSQSLRVDHKRDVFLGTMPRNKRQSKKNGGGSSPAGTPVGARAPAKHYASSDNKYYNGVEGVFDPPPSGAQQPTLIIPTLLYLFYLQRNVVVVRGGTDLVTGLILVSPTSLKILYHRQVPSFGRYSSEQSLTLVDILRNNPLLWHLENTSVSSTLLQ